MSHTENIADEFSKIYSDEWKEAWTELGNDRHEEEVIYLLMRIVRVRISLKS